METPTSFPFDAMAVASAAPLYRPTCRPFDGQGRGFSHPQHRTRWAAATVAVGAGLRAKSFSRPMGIKLRSRVSLLAQDQGTSEESDEAKKLWQEAYAIEVERAERLRRPEKAVALPESPQANAPAAEWQAAYEALKARNLELEMEAVARRRAEFQEQGELETSKADAPVAPASSSQRQAKEPRKRESQDSGEAEEKKDKVLSVLDLPTIDIDSKQLADVARFRDALGPGTLPLLSALFEEARGELPEPSDVRDALDLPGSGFTMTGNLNVGRCVVVRGLLARDVGGRGTPRRFVEQRQASLDRRYGEGKYQVFLQRERPPPAPGFSLWPKGDFDPAQVDSAQKEYPAALLVFRSSDLPIEEGSGNFRRLLIGGSLAATAAFCNIIAAAVGSLNGERSDALLNKSVVDVTYSPMLGVAVTRLDPDGVIPVGAGLLLMLILQGFGRGKAAEKNGAKIRGGYFIPSSSLGTLGRTWSISGLSPSRKTEVEVALAGSYAGFATALLLCLAGVLRGDASDGLIIVEVTRLPLLLAQLLGDSFPDDAVQTVLSLSSGEAAARMPAKVTTLDPLLLSGSLALTTQAVQLLPLRGFDGHLLARFLFGPRPLQLLELCTGVLLLLGAVDRLGPNANATVCSSALFAWAARFFASRETPMPPREDFDDEATASPAEAAAAAVALAAAGAILIPGKLIPYGLLGTSIQ